MAADIIDSTDDGTQTTVTYSDGSVQVIDDASGMPISQTGPSFDNTSQGSSSAPTIVKTATSNGNTYYQMSDGTYQMVDEAGNSYPSNATDFTNAFTGGSQTSTASTATGTSGSTITSSGADTLSGLISKIASGTVNSSDLAKFVSSNSGNIAALAGLAALTGGNNVTTGAYQGSIPKLQAIRNQVNAAVSPNQSQQYFTDTQYVNPADATAVANANASSTAQAQAIIDAAQKQAAARAAAQQAVPGFAMPWVNQTAAGNTPVTAGNNGGLPAVINASSPGYTGTGTTGIGSSTGASTNTNNAAALAAQQAAQLAAQQAAAQQAAQQAAALKAQQDAAAAAAAAKAAAQQAATLKQQQTDIGNIVSKYPNPNNDPAVTLQMQVALAQYADKNGISPAQFANIVSGQSYANSSWSPTQIQSVYKSVDPLAQVVSAYQSGQTPAQVAALAAKNGITTQQLQNYGLGTNDLNSLAAKGYLPTSDLTSLLKSDYQTNTPAGIAAINNIIKSQNLTAAQIQAMYPGLDLNTVVAAGVNIPGYTPTSGVTAGVNTGSNASGATSSNANTGISAIIQKDQAAGLSNNQIAADLANAGYNAAQTIGVVGQNNADIVNSAFSNLPGTGIGSATNTSGMNAFEALLNSEKANTTSSAPLTQQQLDANAAANSAAMIAANNDVTSTAQSMPNNPFAAAILNSEGLSGSTQSSAPNINSLISGYQAQGLNNDQIATNLSGQGIGASDVIGALGSQYADVVNQAYGDIASSGPAVDNSAAASGDTTYGAKGGLMDLHYAHGGATPMQPRYLQGTTDGMADEVPSSIDGVEPAKLSHGEFVIPADVVSHLGNGNSDAGAKKLYQMMDKVRMARTGTKKQGKEINPDKFLAGGSAYANGGAVAFNAGGISDIKGFATGTTVPAATTTSSGVTTPSIGYSTVNALSPWAGDYVTNMLGSAQALANTPMPVYQGELTAGPSTLQNQQFAGLSALANTGAPPVQFQTGTWSNQGAPVMPNVNVPSQTQSVSQAANQGVTGFNQPMQLDTSNTGIAGQYMNPYLQQSLQPQLNLLAQQAQANEQSDLGKLTSQGAFGGSRQAVLQGMDQNALLGQQANLIGQGYNTAYNNAQQQFNNEQQNALNAQNYQQQANQASANFGLNTLNALGTAGATQQGLQQAADTAAQNQFNTQALYPYQQLQFEQSMLSNLPISTQAVVPNTSPLSTVAGTLNTSMSLADALKALGITS